MNMLADKGIPSAIMARSEEENDEGSVTSKTISSVSTGQKENENGNSLARSIREHASRLDAFGKTKASPHADRLSMTDRKRNANVMIKLYLKLDDCKQRNAKSPSK